jgi:hypothetical protein
LDNSTNGDQHLEWKLLFSRLARPEVLIFISTAAFFLLIFLYYPFRARFEFDPDEGINAIKALMLARGFPLYSQIWSDLPAGDYAPADPF